MNSEISFAQNRLTELTQQLLAETSITGDIVFLADEVERRVNGATWRFEDEDHTLLKNSYFKFMLMELLDTLVQHRARQTRSTESFILRIHQSTFSGSPQIKQKNDGQYDLPPSLIASPFST